MKWQVLMVFLLLETRQEGSKGLVFLKGRVHTFPQAGPLTPHSPFFQLEL